VEVPGALFDRLGHVTTQAIDSVERDIWLGDDAIVMPDAGADSVA